MRPSALPARLALLFCLATTSAASADIPPPPQDSTPEPSEPTRRGCSVAALDEEASVPTVLLGFALLARGARLRARRSRDR